jgi:hypothetical protein
VQIALHVKHYNAPELQRHVVRIIFMVPIYALVSWLSLRFVSARRWLSPVRECYEAIVLYSFYSYLIACLRLKTGNYEAWLETLPPQEPTWPMKGTLGRAVGVHTIDSGADFMHAMRQVRAFVSVFWHASSDSVRAQCECAAKWSVSVLRGVSSAGSAGVRLRATDACAHTSFMHAGALLGRG